MPVRVRVPTPLRKFTNGADEVNAQGNDVKTLVDDLEKLTLASKNGFVTKAERFAVSLTLYVNGDDIRFLQNLETALKEGDNISIVPAIAGGI